MSIFGIFPRQDRIYQNYHVRQFRIARNRIAYFPLTNSFVDNFKGYENLKWKESRNKIFLASTIRPHRIWRSDLDFILNHTNKEDVKKSEMESPLIDLNEDENFPETLITLELGFANLVKNRWTPSQIKEFKRRISSYDYFVSYSAFSEIFIATILGKKLGFDKIILNPATSTGKNSDIKILLDNKEIFLELTSTRDSLAEIKIQKIFDDFAKYVGTINKDKAYSISIWINTLHFPLDNQKNIDEEKSKSILKFWANKLHFEKLIDCNLTIPLEYEFNSINNEKFLNRILETQQEMLPNSFANELKNSSECLEWAKNIEITDLNSCPFEHIACAKEGEGPYVHVEGNSSFPSEVGQLEERSFFSKIMRSRIKFKLNNLKWVNLRLLC